jgi:hypothetical protein
MGANSRFRIFTTAPNLAEVCAPALRQHPVKRGDCAAFVRPSRPRDGKCGTFTVSTLKGYEVVVIE